MPATHPLIMQWGWVRLTPARAAVDHTPCLPRLQVVDVIHPGRAPVSKKDLREHVAKLHKANSKTVVLFGFKSQYGE